ncbi:sulfatase-like hydrolase/transferase [Desulfovibrio sp. OttesenSCG-928-F07]|nr:sulfatase-like hydrolase/transferase [Desulfovibrio sp. OttesenSCG-928-F07]
MITHYRRTKLPALIIYLGFLLYTFALLVIARIAFFVWTSGNLADVAATDIIKALYIGIKFDARIAAIFTFPVAAIFTIRPLGRRLYNFRNLLFIFYFLSFFVLWTTYAFDTGFFAYLGERLNATIIELAQDTADGFKMVYESYPLIQLVALVVTFSFITAIPVRKLASFDTRYVKSKKTIAAQWLTGFVIFALCCYGQISSNLFPLRWSNAYFTPNMQVTALALNPIQNLYDTYAAAKDDGFDRKQAAAAYPLMAKLLELDNPTESLNFKRSYPAVNTGKQPNVVIVIMESFSFPKTSFAPGNDDPTPYMKKLAEESVLFDNFFSNARTTARGVFSTITGVPDVTQSSTGSRNQRVIDQRVVANEFAGYERFYLLGGNTNWANIRGIISNNIEQVKILEESYWKAPNVDVWGVSDYDLLQEAHELFTTLNNKPFLAVIQTASYHKPFTIPANTPGFEYKSLSQEAADNYGFLSEQEYNSMRYMDFAVGEFMRKAKEANYYNNTVFLFLGDHGIKDSSTNMTAPYAAAILNGWHVPFIVHAPNKLKPALRHDAASQVDVFPTAAGLAGIAYNNWTMGRDLFSETQNQKRGAFISGTNSTPIRYILDDYCYFDNRFGSTALFKLTDTAATDLKTIEPERFEQMQNTANAIQTTAKYMLYNNKKQAQAR